MHKKNAKKSVRLKQNNNNNNNTSTSKGNKLCFFEVNQMITLNKCKKEKKQKTKNDDRDLTRPYVT